MKKRYWLAGSTTSLILLVSMSCTAESWQDRLSSVSEELTHRNVSAGTQSGGLSLSSLNAMLNGGNTALSANTMANAAGVIEYCTKNKLSSMTNPENIQNQLVNKLGLNHPSNSDAKHDYSQGKQGLLNTRNGQQLNINDLSYSELAAKVKTKACDLVLKQGLDYLAR